MTAVDDLAAWLTQVWDEDEEIAKQGSDWRQGGSPFSYFETSETIGIEVNVPWLLARIAADRQILKLHSEAYRDCRTCHQQYPCATVRLLALPHADRPGHREEWRP